MNTPSATVTDVNDIDLNLWRFLEQFEAAKPWTDLVLPDGLDLSHPGDMDLVCQVAERAEPLFMPW